MVLTAGITPDADLQKLLDDTNAVTNKTRFVRVEINSDQTNLVLGGTAPNSGDTDDKEFDAQLQNVFLPDAPQFLLFQKDDHLWMLIAYIPESSKIRDKMLHASSVGSLKKAFQSARISHELTINCASDMRWAYIYKQHFDINPAELMSDREKIKATAIADEEEARAAAIKAQAVHRSVMGGVIGGGMNFPFNSAATDSISRFQAKEVNYCRYKLEISSETIVLDEASSVSADELSRAIPTTCATFNLYRFIHADEEHIIFAMCMPSGVKLSIKEKMLNASCKNGTMATLSANGVDVQHNLEIDSGDELCERDLVNRVAPDTNDNKGFVKKVKGPGRRAPRKNPQASL